MAGLGDDGLAALIPGSLYVVDPFEFGEKGILQVSRGNLAQANVKINFFFQTNGNLRMTNFVLKKPVKVLFL